MSGIGVVGKGIPLHAQNCAEWWGVHAPPMAALTLLLHLLGTQVPADSEYDAVDRLFAQGTTFAEFVTRAASQRSLWTKPAGGVPADLSARLRRAGVGLRMVVVAEDWCVDSANTVPFVARLADDSGVEMRIVDRGIGRPLLERFRTADGRTATPLVVLFRRGAAPDAWVERPRPLQDLFAALLTDPGARQVLGDRQRWYDEDGGKTSLQEIVALAEHGRAR